MDELELHYPTRRTADIATTFTNALAELPENGVLRMQDVLVPGSRLRGKKANLQRRAGEYVNVFFAWRGVEYGRCLSITQWQKKFQQNGLTIIAQETTEKTVNFDDWIAPAELGKKDRLRARAMLLQAPQLVLDFLTPQITGDRIQFRMTELTISGKLETLS